MKPVVVFVLVSVLMQLPGPAAADSCDARWEELFPGPLMVVDGLAVVVDVVGIARGNPNLPVAGLGILTGTATVLNVNRLRDGCDPRSDTFVTTFAVLGTASIIAGVLAIYVDARNNVIIAPARVMGTAGVVAGLTVRF
jgi:hypothetical protein